MTKTLERSRPTTRPVGDVTHDLIVGGSSHRAALRALKRATHVASANTEYTAILPEDEDRRVPTPSIAREEARSARRRKVGLYGLMATALIGLASGAAGNSFSGSSTAKEAGANAEAMPTVSGLKATDGNNPKSKNIAVGILDIFPGANIHTFPSLDPDMDGDGASMNSSEITSKIKVIDPEYLTTTDVLGNVSIWYGFEKDGGEVYIDATAIEEQEGETDGSQTYISGRFENGLSGPNAPASVEKADTTPAVLNQSTGNYLLAGTGSPVGYYVSISQ